MGTFFTDHQITMAYDDFEICWKWRTERYKKIIGPGYINPFNNRRRKEVFKLLEKIFPYSEFRCIKEVDGEWAIIIKPLNIEKYLQRDVYEKNKFDITSHEESILCFHKRANDAIKEASERINKFNLPFLLDTDENGIVK